MVKVLKSTRLKDDYPNWDEAAALFDHYDGLTKALADHGIPLADSFELQLQVGEHRLDAILLWEHARIVIYETLAQNEKALLTNAGWTVMDVSMLDVNRLKNMLVGVTNG